MNMEENINIRELLSEKTTGIDTDADERIIAYVREQADTDQKRYVLLETERAIKRIAGFLVDRDGRYVEPAWFRNFSSDEADKLVNLIGTRKMVLNEMLRPTPQEVERTKQLNDKLIGLTKEMQENVRLMGQMRKHSESNIDERYNCDIDGTIVFEYGDDDAVVDLDDDGYYGSDFHYMIHLISELVAGDYQTGSPEIERASWQTVEDGTSWKDGSFSDHTFDGIKICHALHTLADIQPYSVPDVLRIDDFVVRATLQYEREITSTESKQDGRDTH